MMKQTIVKKTIDETDYWRNIYWWWNRLLIKQTIDEISRLLMKQTVDETESWRNILLMKQTIDETDY